MGWRAELAAASSRMGLLSRRFDLLVRCSAPLLLLAVCLFVAVQVVRSEHLVWQISESRRIETEMSATVMAVHTVKTRELEYLLTGSDRYLSTVTADRAQAERNFASLRRELARDPEQFKRLITFQAAAEDLLGTTGQAVANYRAGDAEGVRQWFSSAAFARLMGDDNIGSCALMKGHHGHIAELQDRRALAFTRALMGVFALVLGLAAYAAWRVTQMSTHLRQQKLTLRALARAKASAEQARAAAEEASRVKSEFLASVSHELRTPLNAILGFSELMQFQMLGPLGHPRYGEYTADIHKSGRHLLDLVNDILDLSRLSAGKAELRESEFALDQLVADCKILLGGETLRHVRLLLDIPPELPRLHADFRMIKQILLNLLSNAVKFTPEGGTITVAAARVPGGLHLSVADTGIGMSAEDIEKALAPFGQIDSKIARRHHGAGLGLPIARAHAELHGGKLLLESVTGQGTRVTLVLPERRLVEPRRIGILYR
jgi:signal transduction histidine kinase